jgi:hypothetical protein
MSDEIRLSANASIILGDREVLSEVEITSDCQVGQATVAELAEGARQHYEKVSRIAHEWYSLIPDAIDAWEREQTTRLRRPSLLARLRGLFRQLWSGRCEGCRAKGCCQETVLLP